MKSQLPVWRHCMHGSSSSVAMSTFSWSTLLVIILTRLILGARLLVVIFVIFVILLFFLVTIQLETIVVLELLQSLDLWSESNGLEALNNGLAQSQHIANLDSQAIKHHMKPTSSRTVPQVTTRLAVFASNSGRMISRRAPLTSSTLVSRTFSSIFSL